MSKSAGGGNPRKLDTAVFDLFAQSVRAQRDDLVSVTQQCSSNGQKGIEVPGTRRGDDESFHGSCLSKALGIKHLWPLAHPCPTAGAVSDKAGRAGRQQDCRLWLSLSRERLIEDFGG